jgi:hypothetical protein
MLFSIWFFFKQKKSFEKKVFDQHYFSESCKNISDFRSEKISSFLGERNTPINRFLWLKYFMEKSKLRYFIFMGFLIIFILFFFHIRNNTPEFNLGFSLYIFLCMAFAFIMPAIANFKAKSYEAVRLISELDKKMIEIE